MTRREWKRRKLSAWWSSVTKADRELILLIVFGLVGIIAGCVVIGSTWSAIVDVMK